MRLRMFSQRLRNIGISSPGIFSATGTRGSLTMPHSIASLKELASTLGQFDALAQFERVKVGDHDLGPVHIVEHVVGNDLDTSVVAVGVIWLQNAQSIFDRQAGCADQKAAGEMLTRRTS